MQRKHFQHTPRTHHQTSPRVWANNIFGSAELGDRRRTRRLVELAGTMAANPLSSFCKAFKTWPKIKGAYRLIENEKITTEQLQEPSTTAAVEACRGKRKVLAVADTTFLNFTNHRATTGLGPIGGLELQGLILHSSIALTPEGMPLGLLRQQSWVRDPAKQGSRHRRQERPLEEKESYRWVQSVQEGSAAMDTLPDSERPYVIHIFDREGDIHEVFDAVQQTGDGAIIRSSWNRRVKNPVGHLHKQVLAAKALGRNSIEVPRKQGQRKRQAEVEYRACQVTFNSKRPNRSPRQLNAVAVVEVGPPEETIPLQWILLTTEPIDTFKDALEVVRMYKLRWRIEEYYNTPKKLDSMLR